MCAWQSLVGSGEGREKGRLNISKRRQNHLYVVRNVHRVFFFRHLLTKTCALHCVYETHIFIAPTHFGVY
jgi:hypothetical protein